MYEFLRYILNLALRTVFQRYPCLGAEFVDTRSFSVLRAEARDFVEGVDGYEHHISVFVGQLDHLLHPSLVIAHSHQTSEHTYSVVYMYYIVPYVEG